MSVAINMNDRVTVTLTQAGADLLNRPENRTLASSLDVFGFVSEGDEFSTQLWMLLRDLGPCWSHASHPPFVGNVMHVEPSLRSLRSRRPINNDCDDATTAHVDDCNGELA